MDFGTNMKISKNKSKNVIMRQMLGAFDMGGLHTSVKSSDHICDHNDNCACNET